MGPSIIHARLNVWYRLDFLVNISQVLGHCLEHAKTLESYSLGILDYIRIVLILIAELWR